MRRSAILASLEVQKHFRQALACPECGLSRIVENVSLSRRGGYRPEVVTAHTHCACSAKDGAPAGPAYRQPESVS